MDRNRRMHLILGLLACFLASATAFAQQAQQQSSCLALAGEFPGIVRASFTPAQSTQRGAVTITYAGHSTYMIETPAGVRIATDFSGSMVQIRCRASSP